MWSSELGFMKRGRGEGAHRRKIRLIEDNAKCGHLKKLTCKGTMRRSIYVWVPEPHHTPPPLHTVYVYIVYLFKQGRGRGES
jgi:hypothetical protein